MSDGAEWSRGLDGGGRGDARVLEDAPEVGDAKKQKRGPLVKRIRPAVCLVCSPLHPH